MIKNDKKKLRACKYCGEFFWAAGRAPRVCPKCFKKNKKTRILRMKNTWAKRSNKKEIYINKLSS